MSFQPVTPLRIAFIGGALNSAVGYTHFNASRLDGHFRVEAGCFSRNPEHNQHTAQTYGIPPERTHATWEALLAAEKGRVDALVILTPTPSHADIVVAALDAGFRVICEKSLGTSSEECRLIEEAVQRNRGYLAVTFNYSGYPMVRELRSMIREGRMGTVQQIQVEMPQEGYLRLRANPQAWRRKDHEVPTVSLDLGVHVHHLVDFLTDGKVPVKLTGEEASYGQFNDLIDNVYCLAQYQDDLRVQAWWGKTALGHRNGLRIRVFGSLASAEWFQMDPEMLHWADTEGRHMVLDRGTSSASVAQEARYNRFKAGHPSGFIEAFANLYADIAADLRQFQMGHERSNDHVFGAHHAMAGLEMMESLKQAARQKKWLTLRPE